MKILVTVILIGFIFYGCSSKLVYLKDDYRISDNTADIQIKSLKIVDERKNVTNRELKIPFFSLPGKKDEITPPSEQHQQLIKSEIYSYINNTGIEVDVIAFIEHGIEQFRTSLFAEIEYVNFKIRINLYDNLHVPYLMTTYAESFYEVRSFDASQEFIEQLYQKAIKTCIYKCFESISKFTKDQQYDPNQQINKTKKI